LEKLGKTIASLKSKKVSAAKKKNDFDPYVTKCGEERVERKVGERGEPFERCLFSVPSTKSYLIVSGWLAAVVL